MTLSLRRTLRRRPNWIAGAILVSSLAIVSVARAEDASEYDKKARSAFERRDYAAAAEAFEEAYSVKPHPATKYNAALAWDKAQQYARAADAYEAALNSEGLDTGRAEAARTRLAALKPQLGYVFVEKPIGATLSIEHVKDLPIPARFHVEPGAHVLVVKGQGGRSVERKLTVKAGSTSTVSIEEDELASSAGAVPTKTSPAAKPEPDTTEPPPTKDGGSCSSCTWGWIAIGGAVIAAGAGTYFGLQTLSERKKFEDSQRTNADARDKAIQSRTFSNIAFGVAVVAGGVGLYLVLSGKKSGTETSKNLRVELGVHPGGVSTALRF